MSLSFDFAFLMVGLHWTSRTGANTPHQTIVQWVNSAAQQQQREAAGKTASEPESVTSDSA